LLEVKPMSSWNSFVLAPAGSAASHGRIAAVSRIPNSMEVWWIGADGSVQDSYWYEGAPQWQRFPLAPAGSASIQGGVAAVSRIPNSMEVWWIGANGSIQAAFWYDGGQWTRYELAPAWSASIQGGITAVSRIPNSMEVWWIGADGSVQDSYWYEGAPQWQRFPLAPAGSASIQGGVAAVSRIPTSMEVWYIERDGSVRDSYWYDTSSPSSFTLALDSFEITNTRSRHEDTDFVSVAVTVGTRAPLTQTRSLGDLNNGTFPLNMAFPNLQVRPHENVTLNYVMVNAGHQDPSAVEQGIKQLSETLAQKAATAAATAAGGAVGAALGASIGTAVVPLLGTALGALAGWIINDVWGFLFADCDGPVAAAVHVLKGSEILAAQQRGGMVVRDEHPGVDSPAGCGSNSHYFVTWSVH
jgi:hypothetical protein